MKKHRTSNIEHPTPSVSGGVRRPFTGGWPLNNLHWLLIVGCWLLVVSPAFATEPSATSPQTTAAPAATNTALDEAAVTKLLTAALQEQFTGGELTLRFTRPWISLPVHSLQSTVSSPESDGGLRTVDCGLLGPFTLKILEMPNSGVTTAFIVRFEITTASGASLGPWQMPVQAHLWRDIPVAHSMLKPGQAVADADIALERRDVLALREPLAEFADGDTTLEIAGTVPAGTPLFARAVKLRAIVHRGEMTNARLEEGALSVTMKAQALEDGTPGQTIRLRNLQSARDFSGKVLDAKTVLVSL
jgi:flagella basal body P-ring formation protein FlgA